MLHNHPLFFPSLDSRGSAYHILDGLRQALIAKWAPSQEPYRLILNVPDDENRDNLKTHVEEFKSLLTDGVGAIAELIAEVELYAPEARENARHIRPALLLVAELMRALPLLDRLEELADGGVPVTAAGPKEAAVDG